MGQCVPNPFSSEIDGDGWYTFDICCRPNGSHASFNIGVPSTESGDELSESEKLRLAAHNVIQYLPNGALNETIESLTGIYEFHQKVASVPSLTLPQQPESFTVKIVATQKSPILPPPEE